MKNLSVSLVLGFALAAAATPTEAGLVRMVGELADAQFVSNDGCVVTTTDLFAINEAGASSFAFMQYVRQDACTGALLGSASAGGPLGSDSFTVDPSLRRATLSAVLQGAREDGSPVTFVLALDWAGTDGPFLSLSGSRVRSPGSAMGIHAFSRSYQAQATGSVMDGAINLAAGGSTAARIGVDRLGTLTLDTALVSMASAPFTIVEPNHFDVVEAGAAFSATDSTGCIFSQAFVFATDGMRQTRGGPPEPVSLVSIFAFSVDNCANRELLDAFAERPLLPGELSVARRLGSARLAGSIMLHDRVSGGTVPLDFDVTWTAAGEPTRTLSHDVQTAPNGFTRHHSITTVQPATTVGAFPGLLEASSEGALSEVRAGELDRG